MIKTIKIPEIIGLIIFIVALNFYPAKCQTINPDFSFSQECKNFQFTDLSTSTGGEIESWHWNFGDGAQSNDQNPTHVYMGFGEFEVSLTVTHELGMQSSISKDVAAYAVTADFIAAPVCFGGTTSFSDNSATSPDTDLTSWEWDFDDDGSFDATGQNTVNLFPSPGIYPVSLRVYNEEGCYDIATKDVIVYEKPTADFINDTVCFGEITTFTDNSTTPAGTTITEWHWDFENDGTYDASGPNVTHLYLTAGVAQVKLLIVNNEGCSDSIYKNVPVYDLPIADFNASAECLGQPTQFSDNSTTPSETILTEWHWDFDNDGTYDGSGQTISFTFTSPGIFPVNLMVIDNQGCSDTIIKNVEVYKTPVAVFTASAVCLGEATQFESNSTTPSGTVMTDWNWDFDNDGVFDASGPNQSYTFSLPGTHPVKLVVINNQGCSDTVMKDVEVYETPSAHFNYSIGCVNLPTHFYDASTPTGQIISWKWTIDGIYTILAQNITYTFVVPGNHTVKLSVTGSNGCVDDTLAVIEIEYPPVSQFVANMACLGDTSYFINQTNLQGVDVANWSWNFDDPASASNTSFVENPMHVFSGPGDFTVKLIVENVFGCIDSISNTVTVHDLPTPDFTYPSSVAVGNMIVFQDISIPSGNSPIIIRHWDFGDGTYGINPNPVIHTYDTAGIYTVCLTVTNVNGCIDSICHTISITALPNADFTYQSGSNLQTFYYDNSYPDSTIVDWYWDFGDLTVESDTISGTATPSYIYPDTGFYNVYLKVTDTFGGVRDTTKSVYVGNSILADFQYDDVCFGEPVNLIDMTYSPISASLISWNWVFGDGSDSTYYYKIDTLSHIYETSGTYNVVLIANGILNGFYVSDTVRKAVSVYSFPVARIDTLSLVACLGSPVHFIDSSYTVDSDSIVHWNWDFGDGMTSSSQNANHVYDSISYYNVYLTVGTSHYCESTDSVIAKVTIAPNITFTTENTCVNSPTYFLPSESDVEITKWKWNFGDPLSGSANISTEQFPTHVYDRIDNYKVTMIASSYSCSKTLEKSFIVKPIPFSGFSLTQNVGGVQGKTSFSNSSIYATHYLWDFGNGQISQLKNPTEVYELDSTYTITLISYNEYGCSDTTRDELKVFFKGLYFPTAFSPNNPNEGINKFEPKGVNLKEFMVQVFDLRGNKLWESDKVDENGKPLESWDGYYNGRLMPEGTYVWKAKGVFRDGTIWKGSTFQGVNPQTEGTVTLIK